MSRVEQNRHRKTIPLDGTSREKNQQVPKSAKPGIPVTIPTRRGDPLIPSVLPGGEIPLPATPVRVPQTVPAGK